MDRSNSHENEYAIDLEMYAILKIENVSKYREIMSLIINDLMKLKDEVSSHEIDFKKLSKGLHQIQPILKHIHFLQFYDIVKICLENNHSPEIIMQHKNEIIACAEFALFEIQKELY